jgi:hypothetical protein
MNIDRKTSAILLLATLATGACTPNDITLGASVRNNSEAQIVEPDPKYDGDMAASGDQTAAAQERYRKGNVKKPVGVKTTTGGTGRSGGSSSGGGN